MGWLELTCNGPEDCPGGACCATVEWNSQMPYLAIDCAPSCDPSKQLTLCSEANPDVCVGGTSCEQSQILGQGYMLCFN